jgi:hypothetical protein
MKSALESESSFLEALKSFRKVRSSKTYNVGIGAKGKGKKKEANVRTLSSDKVGTNSSVVGKGIEQAKEKDIKSLPLPPKELWSGISLLLESHFPPGPFRDSISAKALDLHYQGLRSLNWEDIDDIATMFSNEAEAEAAAAAATTTTTTTTTSDEKGTTT